MPWDFCALLLSPCEVSAQMWAPMPGSAEFYMAVSRASFVLNPFGEASALLTLVAWLNCLMFRESLPDGLCRIAGINKTDFWAADQWSMPKCQSGESGRNS